ncbi:hypothetical protein NQZ68_036305 [Dissostichus eleginoides]|nr:hypothetical protein NQZ68_036305 [Dissostichus eleginoides]
MTQHIYSSLPATHRQIVFYTSVRSLSHRPPELPANLPASSFTIPPCPNNLAIMDPAGSDLIREALSNQGVLVGRHDQMLREVMDNLASLAANVAQMGHHLNLVSTHLAPPAPEDPAPPQELAPVPAQPALPSR